MANKHTIDVKIDVEFVLNDLFISEIIEAI
jgi:hypothetical protein